MGEKYHSTGPLFRTPFILLLMVMLPLRHSLTQHETFGYTSQWELALIFSTSFLYGCMSCFSRINVYEQSTCFLVPIPFKLFPLLMHAVSFHCFSACRDPWQHTGENVSISKKSVERTGINRKLFKKRGSGQGFQTSFLLPYH